MRQSQSGGARTRFRRPSLVLIIIALPILIGGLALALNFAELYLNSSPDRSAVEVGSAATPAVGSNASPFGGSAPVSVR